MKRRQCDCGQWIADNVSGDTKSDEQHGGYVSRTAQQSKNRKKVSMAELVKNDEQKPQVAQNLIAYEKLPERMGKIRSATVDGPTRSPTPKEVDGVVYDITKSVRLACEGDGSFEEQAYAEQLEYSDLYRTRDGHWFAFCSGGRNTRWNTEIDGACFQGYAIVPLTDNEAKEWLESRCWRADNTQLKAIKRHFKGMFDCGTDEKCHKSTKTKGKNQKGVSMTRARKKSAASNVEQMFKEVTYKANSIVEIWKRNGKRVKVTISFFPIDGKEEVHVALAAWRDKQEERNDG